MRKWIDRYVELHRHPIHIAARVSVFAVVLVCTGKELISIKRAWAKDTTELALSFAGLSAAIKDAIEEITG